MAAGEDDAEVRTNFMAALTLTAAVTSKEETIASVEDKLEGCYELCFNVATCMLSLGDISGAEGKVREAVLLCKESLEEEDYTPEEIEEELGSMRVQLAFIEQARGNAPQAETVYSEYLHSAATSKTVNAVAANNLLVIRRKRDMFDSFKR